MANLPPLNKVDEDLNIGFSETKELQFLKCKHELYLISSTEARCSRCSVGYQGTNIIKLVKASKSI